MGRDGSMRNNRGGGRGQGRGGGAYGVSGECICAKCGTITKHRQGVPCTEEKCPKCGHVMARREMLEEARQRKATK